MVVSYGMDFSSSNTPLIIFGILNTPIARIMQYNQAQFMVAQDETLRATSEVLNNMKIIKLQSWEEKFKALVESLRDVEYKWLRDIQITKSFGSALYWMAPTVVSTVIFVGTAALNSASLNAGTIFTVLVALHIICDTVRMFPEALSVLIQVKVSLDQISIFLLEDEVKNDGMQRRNLSNMDRNIQLQHGCFSWDLDVAIPTLKNLNLGIIKE